jgi:DNA-binding transcriptional ArsR family regulator
MNDHRIKPLDTLLARDDVLDVSAPLLNLIAVRLEEALRDPRSSPLTELARQLEEAAVQGAAKVPIEVMAEIRSKGKKRGPSALAYALGQLVFAQTMASNSSAKRADEEFVEMLKSIAGRQIAAELLDREASSGELAKLLDERPETMSRRLARFRELGITDYRKDGTTVYNFLTPAGRSLAESLNLRSGAIPKPNRNARDYFGEPFARLGPEWKDAPNFAPEAFGGDEDKERETLGGAMAALQD